MMNFIQISLLLGLKFVLVYSSATSGPVGPIKVYSLGECNPPINNIDLAMELKTEEDKSKNVKVKFDLPQDYEEGLKILLVAARWEDNKWHEDVYSTDGDFFKLMNDYFPKIWKNFRSAAKPKIEDANRIPAGEYEVEVYQDTWKNVDLPQILYGRFLVKITLSLDEEDLVCIMAEGEAFEP